MGNFFSFFIQFLPPRNSSTSKKLQLNKFSNFLITNFCPDTSVWFISFYNTWRLVYMCNVFLWEQREAQKLLNISLCFGLNLLLEKPRRVSLTTTNETLNEKLFFQKKNISKLPSPSWDYTFFFGVCCSLFFSFNHAIAIYVCWSKIKNITLLRELTDRRVLVSNDGLIKKKRLNWACWCVRVKKTGVIVNH